nr:MAG TPA: hypothetical protein [Caudoviricetes sp.]
MYSFTNFHIFHFLSVIIVVGIFSVYRKFINGRW